MAYPWDDGARDFEDQVDQLVQAYGRGEIDLGLPGGAGTAPVPSTFWLNTVPTYEDAAGLNPVNFVPAAPAAPAPLPLLLPPVAIPGTPENDQFVKALSDIWNGVVGQGRSDGGAQNVKQNPYERECENLYASDTTQCNQVTRRRGSEAGDVCHQTASQRFGECLKGGLANVRTPLYLGW